LEKRSTPPADRARKNFLMGQATGLTIADILSLSDPIGPLYS
jgi:hypothetical protein